MKRHIATRQEVSPVSERKWQNIFQIDWLWIGRAGGESAKEPRRSKHSKQMVMAGKVNVSRAANAESSPTFKLFIKTEAKPPRRSSLINPFPSGCSNKPAYVFTPSTRSNRSQRYHPTWKLSITLQQCMYRARKNNSVDITVFFFGGGDGGCISIQLVVGQNGEVLTAGCRLLVNLLLVSFLLKNI